MTDLETSWIRFRLREIAPKELERLGADLLERRGHTDIRDWGLSGTDGGVDILSRDPDGAVWATQAKRVQQLGPKAARKEIQKIYSKPPEPRPKVYLLIATCPIGRAVEEALSRRAREDAESEQPKLSRQPLEIKIWSQSQLVQWLGDERDLFDRYIGSPKERAGHSTFEPLEEESLMETWFAHVVDDTQWLRDHFGALGRPEPLAVLEKTWVELRLQPESRHALEGTWTGRQFELGELLALDARAHPWVTGRWLIQGPPGSGKTTLLRRQAGLIARQRDQEKIPVFVSLARLSTDHRPLLEVATDGLRAAGLTRLVSFLERAGAEGRLVLFLDGLDEVPPERRESVSTLLDHLERNWEFCPIVLSTRPLGRGEIPRGYPHLELLPLSRQRQLEFLTSWLAHGDLDHEQAASEAATALDSFYDNHSLATLVGIPLYLTLLALLWQTSGRPPERLALLYDDIFDLLLDANHNPNVEPIPARADVRTILARLAFGMTVDDATSEPPSRLEQRLRGAAYADVLGRLNTVAPWRASLRRFLDDVFERTHILGPHDGRYEQWRFWHRTFREALTAECLRDRFGDDINALVAWVRDLSANEDSTDGGRGEGRWAEPLALLAGRLDEPDLLVTKLAETKPLLAMRSMVFTRGLAPETMLRTLGLTDDLGSRAQVFSKIPTQLDEPRACLELVEVLKRNSPSGFDYFWLGWILEQVEGHWPGHARDTSEALDSLFEHGPTVDPELFRTVRTPIDGPVDLWCDIPEGEGFIGSREGHANERPRHQVSISEPFRMAAVPITNRQYAAFDPSRADASKPDHPVVGIDWYEAMAFCRWLGTLPDFAGARLPSEREWEYACRAGSSSRYWNGDSVAHLARIGWFYGNSHREIHIAGEFPANPWGLYDVHGNIWEWTASRSTPDYSAFTSPSIIDPGVGPISIRSHPLDRRVFRGGSFGRHAAGERAASRRAGDPWIREEFHGFRAMVPGTSPPR